MVIRILSRTEIHLVLALVKILIQYLYQVLIPHLFLDNLKTNLDKQQLLIKLLIKDFKRNRLGLHHLLVIQIQLLWIHRLDLFNKTKLMEVLAKINQINKMVDYLETLKIKICFSLKRINRATRVNLTPILLAHLVKNP